MMRVITGSARGRRLETLPGEDITRPTSESVKEALFSMIQFEIEDARVLDLFAGSGQLGIFVENNKSARAVTERNITHCGFEQKSQVVLRDAVSFLSGSGRYDIAFLDPPYHKGLVEKAMPLLVEKMSENGIISCETARDEELPERFGDFTVWRSRAYGKIKLTVYRKDGKE